MAVTRIWDQDNGTWHLVGGTLPVTGGGGGGGDFLPLAGGTLSGPLTLAADPTAAMHAATKQYIDARTPAVYASATKLATARTIDLVGDVTATAVAFDGTANIAITTVVDGALHTHTQYEPIGHTHSEYAPTHSHPYSASSHNHDTVYLQDSGTDTMSGTLYIATALINGLGPNELWVYNNVNGSIRWMGVGVGVGQSHGSSSEAYKKEIKPVDPYKGIFSRLRPVHFKYRANFKYRDRFDDSWDTFETPEIGRMGFLYEEVEKIAPHLVYETEGLKAVAYEGMLSDFIAWATASIQYLLEKEAEREAA